MNKKRLASLFLVLSSALLLSGCGKKTESLIGEVADKNMETPSITVAVISGTKNNGQQETAVKFINLLSEKRIDEAIAMMDANEDTKQGWGVNFNTIKSLKIKKVEPVYEEDWTAEREIYKFTLEVSVTPEGEGYGWENGENFRWVSVEKNNGVWQIHELANNP